MIKNRSLMIGIGIGIIIGAVLLQLFNIGKGQTMLDGTQLTADQIREAAQAQNMQVYASTEKVYSSDEWKQLQQEEKQKQEAAKQAKEKANGQDTTKEPTSEQPTTPEDPTTPESKETKTTTNSTTPKTSNPSSPTQPNTPTTFKITSGEMLNDIAYNLKTEGVIDSQKEFVNRVSELKANTKLQVGTFTLNAGEDLDSIIDKITHEPSQ